MKISFHYLSVLTLTLLFLTSTEAGTPSYVKRETLFPKERTVYQVQPAENGYLVYSNYWWPSDGQAELSKITTSGLIDASFSWKPDYYSSYLRKIVSVSDNNFLGIIVGYRDEWFQIQKFLPNGDVDPKFQLSSKDLSSSIVSVSMVGLNEVNDYYVLHVRYAEKDSSQRRDSQLCVNKVTGQVIARCGQSRLTGPIEEATHVQLTNEEALVFHKVDARTTNVMHFTGTILNKNFGTNGVARIPRNISYIRDVQRASNGSIYILSGTSLISLNSKGILDTSFGEEGYLDLSLLNTRSCDEREQMCISTQNRFILNNLGQIIIAGFQTRAEQHFLVFKKYDLTGKELSSTEIEYKDNLSRLDIDFLGLDQTGKIKLLTSTWHSMILWGIAL